MKKIFIADDDPAMMALYSRAFKLSGYNIDTAVDGQEALDKLLVLKSKPDLILLDIMMPKLSGFEVLESIKKDADLKKVPVIVLTNLASLKSAQSDLEKVRTLGAEDIVVKSDVDPKELVRRAENLIAQK